MEGVAGGDDKGIRMRVMADIITANCSSGVFICYVAVAHLVHYGCCVAFRSTRTLLLAVGIGLGLDAGLYLLGILSPDVMRRVAAWTHGIAFEIARSPPFALVPHDPFLFQLPKLKSLASLFLGIIDDDGSLRVTAVPCHGAIVFLHACTIVFSYTRRNYCLSIGEKRLLCRLLSHSRLICAIVDFRPRSAASDKRCEQLSVLQKGLLQWIARHTTATEAAARVRTHLVKLL